MLRFPGNKSGEKFCFVVVGTDGKTISCSFNKLEENSSKLDFKLLVRLNISGTLSDSITISSLVLPDVK